MENYDIAIVGGGPSGCSCALALHNSGLRVVLIEKDEFPRDKICGDAIPGPAFKAMDQINPKWSARMRDITDKTEINTSKLYAPNGKTISINWKTYSYNSKRISFDNFLMELVHSETKTTIINERITKIKRKDNNLICQTNNGNLISAKIIIGCDGANSIVRRQLDTAHGHNKAEAIAARIYYANVNGVAPGVNEFYFFKEFPGYFWIFPLPDNLCNVGFGVFQKHQQEQPMNLRKTLDNIIETHPHIAPRFKDGQPQEKNKGYALPIWTSKKAISGERYMLCGDAAFLIDPMQGHGIDKSMWSGILAAKQAMQCISKSDFSIAQIGQYDKAIHKKLGSELSRSMTAMQYGFKYPWLLNLLVNMGQYKPLTQWVIRKLKI